MRGKLEEFVQLSLVVLMVAVYGCQPYEAEDVANLKKQVASLVGQVEDMRKDLEGLQGQEAQTIQIEQALEDLGNELDVLRVELGQHETPASQTASPLKTEAPALQPKLAKPVEPGKPVVQSAERKRTKQKEL